MRRHQGYLGIAAEDRGAAAAIGNFDGVHLGHQAVLDLARDVAQQNNVPFGVVTFEPHPRCVFNPKAAPFRLMTATARAHRLEKLGVEQLYELKFDLDLAGLSAEDFLRQVLVEGLGLTHLIAGADFRFGQNRAGDIGLIRDLEPQLGLGVTEAPIISGPSGHYSSTAIRDALTQGDPQEAAKMLGHWHRIEGAVQHGDKRGRVLGFPTINLWLDELHLPRFGVYAVSVDVLSGPHQGRYDGCASIGARPTFGENRPNLEVFILDFSGDLYGEGVSVALMAFQRPELRFDGADALIAQMQLDVAETRRTLKNLSLV
ncbi:MAG: bifunctional riboflavin kinase/FAD synthetase [Pseudomonadota bacterium]